MRRIMRFDIVLIRLVFTVILVGAGWFLHPIPGHRLISIAVAALISFVTALFLWETYKVDLQAKVD